jgi:hypothetical protein
MIFRDLGGRARDEGVRAIRGVVDGVRRRFASRPENELYVVRGADEHRRGEAVWWSRTDPRADGDAIARAADWGATAAPRVGDDTEVAKSLERVAETIDRLAAQLDAHHTERAEHLDAIEFFLREMLLGNTANARPVVLGGIVDPIESLTPEITLVAEGFPLDVDTPVEVRSRFHDRWICGFAVAEAIDGGPGPCRYRLTRRSDGIPLPILFDARDVRAVSVYQREPAAE